MKTLVLIRHSKSSWETLSKDIERPLSKRGVKDAHLISSNILKVLPKSFIVWSSVAKRTRETALIFSEKSSNSF